MAFKWLPQEKAQKLMQYIQEHREVVIKESIAYEKTDS
jgi:hypothetical protein